MRVAIIGGGIAGLTAAYLLTRCHDVQLFEAAPQVGGHTTTVPVEEAGRTLWIDMGFIVYNERTYPGFTRLLRELGVESEASTMSFSVRCEESGLEYNGSSLNQLFIQRRNLLRLSFYRMLLGILRFHRVAPRLLAAEENPPLHAFLRRHRFTQPMIDLYLLPMAAAIWSTPRAQILDYPARSLAAFLEHHGMLTVNDRPAWRVVRGGSRTYVEALIRPFADRIHTWTPIDHIRRDEGGVVVQPATGAAERFDRVVVATHSDQALALLADPSTAERDVLAAIPYQENDVVLHTDRRFLPRRRGAWASWNYHLNAPGEGGPRVTYYMNLLQNLEAAQHYCVTLNRGAEIDPAQVLARQTMAHPRFTSAGIAAQARWAEINGVRDTYFCGAYWGNGFHEDGLQSAVRIATAFGVSW